MIRGEARHVFSGQEETASQCCQLSDFVARFSDFSDPYSDFFSKKRLATNLATFSGVIGDLSGVLETLA